MENMVICQFSIILLFIQLILTEGSTFRKAEILQRPDDVIGSRCGDDISMTCIVKSKSEIKNFDSSSIPEIQWWSKQILEEDVFSIPKLKKLHHRPSEGVEVHVEVLYVVRSTLMLRNADKSKEAIYQCRASDSDERNDPNVNVFKHWTIEEAPLINLICPKDEENLKKKRINETKVTTTATEFQKTTSTVASEVVQKYFPNKFKSEVTTKAIEEQTKKSQLQTATSTTSKTELAESEVLRDASIDLRGSSNDIKEKSFCNILWFILLIYQLW